MDVLHIRKILVVIAIIWMAITCFACQNDEKVIAEVYHKESGPSEISENLQVYISRAGTVTYTFFAPLYYVYDHPKVYQITPKGLRVIGLKETGDTTVMLTAQYGIHRQHEHVMEAKHHVVIRNLETGEIVESEQLIWDMDAHKVYSNTQTKQTRPDGSVYIGESFVSDENFEHYTIIKPKMVIYEQ